MLEHGAGQLEYLGVTCESTQVSLGFLVVREFWGLVLLFLSDKVIMETRVVRRIRLVITE
jgi:hypothetical protein